MKKFTRKFLLGEHCFGRALRKIGLSMIAILLAVTAFSQAQETLHVWAENADDYCYRQDNDYEVDIIMRDFVKIDTFVLVLDYDQPDADVFSYNGYSGLHAVLDATGNFSITETSPGTLQIVWDSNDDPVVSGTIEPNNEQTVVFTLHFLLDAYPHVYGQVNQFVFDTDLEWDNSLSKYWNQYGQVVNILTDQTFDGSLTVTQQIQEVVVDAGSADCYGEDAIAIVTTPTENGYQYSFNGATFTANPQADVEAPSTDNTVRVRDGECISFIKKFDVDAPVELTYTTEDTVYTDCPGGLGDIEIFASGGIPSYTYYIVPDDEWDQVQADLAASGSKSNANQAVEDYARSNNILQRSPGIYWVAVQDANQCQDMREIEWWTEVEVIDDKDPWNVITGEGAKLMLDCYLPPDVTSGDGRIVFDIEGATPFADGYNVYMNDMWQGRIFSYDSNENGTAVLPAGEYEFHITDSLGCSYYVEYTISQPDPITFLVDHTDASCEESNGTITIDTESIEGGSGDMEDWWWIYSTSPDFEGSVTDTIEASDGGIFTTAEGLAPAVYYVGIFDANDCFGKYVNPNGDNSVKVLTTEFELVYDPIDCYGGTTDVSIEITSGAGNHEFEYGYVNAPGDTTWQTSNTFEDIPSGNHTFVLHDITIDCILPWEIYIEQPRRLTARVIDRQTLPPSCPGNSDGNLVIKVDGGTKFENSTYLYKLDNNPWVQASDHNTFAIDTAMHHILIEDANGCQTELWVDWPNDENIVEFVDTIYTECAEGMINLFNRYGEGCELLDEPIGPLSSGSPHFYFWYPGYYDCPEEEEPDFGYLEYFEWYGDPIEEFTGTITFDINIWTPDSGWITRTLQGVQQIRNPLMYITEVDPEGDPQAVVDNGEEVTMESAYGEGTYWVVVMDEWGCFSNIEEITIISPPALEVELSTVPAGCDGSTDGQIKIEAFNGRFPIPDPDYELWMRYQYVLTQQPHIFTHENWVDQVTWNNFTYFNGDLDNDSVHVINVQAGTYYLAVRDWCGVENTDLIQIIGPIVIEGSDPVEIDWDIAQITDITCNTYDPDEEICVSDDDGAITGLLDATTGGSSDVYHYTLALGQCEYNNGPKAGTANGRFPETNETGDFYDLPAGCYTLTVEDDSLGCQAVYEIEIKEPDCFRVEVDVVHASCFEAHDGIMRYKIWGGTAPYEEATNNVGIWEDASDIPEERWYDTSSEAIDVHDFIGFDRRVRAGHKQVWVRDAHGCIYGPVDVVVDQPDKLQITDVTTEMVSCNDQDELHEGVTDDGSITFSFEGGWNIEEYGYDDYEFWYYVELWPAGAIAPTQTLGPFDLIQEDITFSGLSIGDYTIKIYEYSEDIEDDGYAGPIITEQDYFNDWHTWSQFAPYQNPNLSKCFALYDVSVGEPSPITYDPIDWRNVKCHNETTGEIYVPNITGGTPSITDGYYVGLEGPVDYDASLQSNYATHWYENADDIVWFMTGEDVNEFTFDNLTWGHYTVHIKDANGCWIYKESGEIENPDTLMIEVVELVQQAKCYGGNGIIQIDATGGVGEYMYAVDSTLVPHPGSHTFPNDLDLEEYLAGLNWQASDTFHVSAATWIGYVIDENGCIVGFSTREDGSPIYHHRTTVLQPDPIEADGFDQIPAICYGEANGKITIESIWGGNGRPWTIDVTGTDYKGDPVSETYEKNTFTGIELTGLPASTDLAEEDEEDMTADDWYTIVIYDKYGCKSEEFYQYVTQPEEFVVVLKDKQNAFVCPNDQAGIFEIVVVSGGVPFGTGPDDKPLYEYKWEAYEDEGYSMLIDSLTDDTYGFTRTFLGYAGIYYTVWARDANGCETSRDTFIQAPEPIEFDVRKLTCYGDEKASARITATGTEGRSFRVLYKEILNGTINPDWTVYDGWFTESIDIIDEFLFDDENMQDRHYAIVIEDTMGCRSEVDTLTFDMVQTELMLTATIDGNEIVAEAFGGAVDENLDHHYQYALSVVGEEPDPVWQDDNIFIVEEYNEWVVWVRDYHLRCLATDTVTGGVAIHTIAEVQGEDDESPVIGKRVQVTGVVSAVAGDEGFFMQDANAARSGIWVATDDPVDIAIGDGAVVVGEVAEIDNVTTIIASEVTVTEATWSVEAIDLGSPSEAINEMYESVLTVVKGAGTEGVDEETGQFEIFYELNDSVVVNNWLYEYDPDSIIAGNFYDVTGVVNGALDAFTLEPRMEEDIVDITKTTATEPTLKSVEFRVYPNPCNEYIYIDNHDKLSRVVISDIAGKRVIDIKYPSREISTDNLVNGVYVVSMFTENGRAKTERIIKSTR